MKDEGWTWVFLVLGAIFLAVVLGGCYIPTEFDKHRVCHYEGTRLDCDPAHN